MARLQAYTQKQLASSIIGVPQADRSGEIIAGAIKQGTEKILGSVVDFNLKKIEAEDSLAVNAVSESRDLAKLEMQKFMVDNPDPSTWESGRQGIVQRQQKTFSDQKFSLATSKTEGAEQRAFEQRSKLTVNIAASKQTVQNDITASGKNYINIKSNPLSTPEEIQKQKGLYQAALERGNAKEVADVKMQETDIQADEQKIENLNKIARNFASIEPEKTIGSVTDELAARKEGKKIFEEFAELSNSDLEAVRDYAGTVGDKNDGESKLAMDKAKVNDYGLIRDGDADLDAMSDAVQLDPTISDEDKATHAEKIRSYFSLYNSAIKEDVITSDTTIIKMGKINKRIKRGKITMDEGIDEYKALKKEVGKDTINATVNKKFLNDVFVSSEQARDTRIKKQTSIYDSRENQIRDAIQKQPNLLGSTEADEVLKDFANEAVIEFNNNFIDTPPEQFNKDEVKSDADRIIRKFTLSSQQQTVAVAAKNLKQAETLAEQQEILEKSIKFLRGVNDRKFQDAAQSAEDEAIRLGIFMKDGDTVIRTPTIGSSGTKKKAKPSKQVIKSLIENMFGGS